MIFRNISLRYKLVTLMMGISLFLSIIVTVFFSYNEYQNQRNFLKNELSLQTKLLSDFLVSPMTFNDKTEINKVISNMKQISEISEVSVYDSNFILITSFVRTESKAVIHKLTQKNKYDIIDDGKHYAITRPIYFESVILGYIHISITKNAYYNNLRNYAYNTAAILSLALCLVYFTSFFLQRIISKPIETLTKHFQKSEFNDVNSLQPIKELDSKDEFSILYKSYNQMLAKLVQDYNEIENAKNELIIANEVKTKILQNMSHELRTPLNGIIGNAAFLMMSELEADDSMMVNMIYRSGKRLLITFESLISLSQFENNEVDLALSRYNLSEYIQEYYSKLDILSNKPNLSLKYTILDQAAYSYIDPEYFSQALFQLVDNAVKFTTEGNIDIQVDSRIENDNKYSTISIIDTGIGISSDKIESMFEIFKQGSEGLSRKYEGIGIGLTLARKIVKMHSGDIEVVSEQGKGSIFRIILPFIEKKANN